MGNNSLIQLRWETNQKQWRVLGTSILPRLSITRNTSGKDAVDSLEIKVDFTLIGAVWIAEILSIIWWTGSLLVASSVCLEGNGFYFLRSQIILHGRVSQCLPVPGGVWVIFQRIQDSVQSNEMLDSPIESPNTQQPVFWSISHQTIITDARSIARCSENYGEVLAWTCHRPSSTLLGITKKSYLLQVSANFTVRNVTPKFYRLDERCDQDTINVNSNPNTRPKLKIRTLCRLHFAKSTSIAREFSCEVHTFSIDLFRNWLIVCNRECAIVYAVDIKIGLIISTMHISSIASQDSNTDSSQMKQSRVNLWSTTPNYWLDGESAFSPRSGGKNIFLSSLGVWNDTGVWQVRLSSLASMLNTLCDPNEFVHLIECSSKSTVGSQVAHISTRSKNTAEELVELASKSASAATIAELHDRSGRHWAGFYWLQTALILKEMGINPKYVCTRMESYLQSPVLSICLLHGWAENRSRIRKLLAHHLKDTIQGVSPDLVNRILHTKDTMQERAAHALQIFTPLNLSVEPQLRSLFATLLLSAPRICASKELKTGSSFTQHENTKQKAFYSNIYSTQDNGGHKQASSVDSDRSTRFTRSSKDSRLAEITPSRAILLWKWDPKLFFKLVVLHILENEAQEHSEHFLLLQCETLEEQAQSLLDIIPKLRQSNCIFHPRTTVLEEHTVSVTKIHYTHDIWEYLCRFYHSLGVSWLISLVDAMCFTIGSKNYEHPTKLQEQGTQTAYRKPEQRSIFNPSNLVPPSKSSQVFCSTQTRAQDNSQHDFLIRAVDCLANVPPMSLTELLKYYPIENELDGTSSLDDTTEARAQAKVQMSFWRETVLAKATLLQRAGEHIRALHLLLGHDLWNEALELVRCVRECLQDSIAEYEVISLQALDKADCSIYESILSKNDYSNRTNPSLVALFQSLQQRKRGNLSQSTRDSSSVESWGSWRPLHVPIASSPLLIFHDMTLALIEDCIQQDRFDRLQECWKEVSAPMINVFAFLSILHKHFQVEKETSSPTASVNKTDKSNDQIEKEEDRNCDACEQMHSCNATEKTSVVFGDVKFQLFQMAQNLKHRSIALKERR